MIRFMTVAVCLVLASPGLDAANKEDSRLEDGGSVGLQLGARATDLVLLVMNDRGVRALLDSKVKLGGNAFAAAGRISAHTIVTSTGISVPAAGRRFVDALERNAPRNESQKVTRTEQ